MISDILLYANDQKNTERKRNYLEDYLDAEESYALTVESEDVFIETPSNLFTDGSRFTLYFKLDRITDINRYLIMAYKKTDGNAFNGIKVHENKLEFWGDNILQQCSPNLTAHTWYKLHFQVKHQKIYIYVNDKLYLESLNTQSFAFNHRTTIGYDKFKGKLNLESLPIGMKFYTPDMQNKVLSSFEEVSVAHRYNKYTPVGRCFRSTLRGDWKYLTDEENVGFAVGYSSSVRILKKKYVKNNTDINNYEDHIDLSPYIGTNIKFAFKRWVFNEDLSLGVLHGYNYDADEYFALVCHNILHQERAFYPIEFSKATRYMGSKPFIRMAWTDMYNGQKGIWLTKGNSAETPGQKNMFFLPFKANGNYSTKQFISLPYSPSLVAHPAYGSGIHSAVSHTHGWLVFTQTFTHGATDILYAKKLGENRWVKIENDTSNATSLMYAYFEGYSLSRVLKRNNVNTVTELELINCENATPERTETFGDQTLYIYNIPANLPLNGYSQQGLAKTTDVYHSEGLLLGKNKVTTRNKPNQVWDFTDPKNVIISSSNQSPNTYADYLDRAVSISGNGWMGNFGDYIMSEDALGGADWFSAFKERLQGTFQFEDDRYFFHYSQIDSALDVTYKEFNKHESIKLVEHIGAKGNDATFSVTDQFKNHLIWKPTNVDIVVLDFSSGKLKYLAFHEKTLRLEKAGSSLKSYFYDESAEKLYTIYTHEQKMYWAEFSVNWESHSVLNTVDQMVFDYSEPTGIKYQNVGIYSKIFKRASGKLEALITFSNDQTNTGASVPNPKILYKDPNSLSFKVLVDSEYDALNKTTNYFKYVYPFYVEKTDQAYVVRGEGSDALYDASYNKTLNSLTNVVVDGRFYMSIAYKNVPVNKEGYIGFFQETGRADRNYIYDVNDKFNIKVKKRSFWATPVVPFSHYIYKDYLYSACENGLIIRTFINDRSTLPISTLIDVEYREDIPPRIHSAQTIGDYTIYGKVIKTFY